MPEVLEVEATRRASSGLIGRTVTAVERTDPLVVRDGVDTAICGRTIGSIERHGKLLLLVTDGPTIGVHFGMTGRLVIDDATPIERLAYGSTSDDPVWDRWIIGLADGGRMRLHDPRRLGRVVLEPDVDRLGPDALTLSKRELRSALARRRAPLKAVLLDQAAVAGLGNLLVDEVLWWAGVDPHRVASSLVRDEVDVLQRTIRRRLPVMARRGGSHTGTLSPAVRSAAGPCPRDGAPLRRDVVGGRTTVWCACHQR